MHIKPKTWIKTDFVALMCLCSRYIHNKIYESKFYFYCRIAEWYSFLLPLVVTVICCFHFNSYDGKVVYYSIQWKFHRRHSIPFLPSRRIWQKKTRPLMLLMQCSFFLLLWPKEEHSNGKRQKSECEKQVIVKFGCEKKSEMNKLCISCSIHTRMRFFLAHTHYKCTHMQWPITHLHGRA